jgi:predicted neuraminidase
LATREAKKSAAVTDPAILDLSLEPPLVNTNPGPQYQDENREFAGAFFGIDRTPGGRLWAGWASGGDSEKAFMLLASSDDDGKTWTKPRVAIDPTDPAGVPGGRSAIVGNVWTDPKGRLWVFFSQSLGYFDGRGGCWFIRCDNPDAEEPVWTKPERIGEGFPFNKPTVLKNGDWLLSAPLFERKHISPFPAYGEAHRDLDAIRMANVYASSDEGKTWTRRGGALIPKTNFDEHMIVELKDGRLWMMARTDYGLAETFSSDGGKTWSDPQPSKIQHISTRFFLRRLDSGNILLVKNGPIDRRLPTRSNLMAFLSKDEGKTWSDGLFLDERSDVSYPDGTQGPDGTIYILYDCNRTQPQREILLAKLREEDFDKPVKVSRGDARQMGRPRFIVSKATGPQKPYHVPSTMKADPKWTEQAEKDAKEDVRKILFEGKPPNKMVVDPILREWADGSWTLFFMAGGMVEPAAENHTVIMRSTDQGVTWSGPEVFDTGLPREGKTVGQCATELFVDGNRGWLFFSTHSKDWRYDWKSWVIETTDAGKTWSKPVPAPGRLADRTFLRNGIIARDGRYILPFQHYVGWPAGKPAPHDGIQPDESSFLNPRNGVLISNDQGKTWTEHGDIRLTPNDAYFGWAENTVAEMADGRIVMLIRADGLGGVLYQAVSKDGGKTWGAAGGVGGSAESSINLAIPMGGSGTAAIHNPGSKVRLFSLGGNNTALVHNPDPERRRRMSLWLSFDGMPHFPFKWPYQRVLQEEAANPKIGISYPDGFVSKDGKWLHLVYDDSRDKLVYYRARLPQVDPAASGK